MPNGDEKPKKATPGEIAAQQALEAESKGKGLGGLSAYKPLFVTLVIALIVSWGMMSFMGVSRGDFTNNINALSGSITANKTEATSLINSLSAQLSSITSKLDALESKSQPDYSTTISDLSAQVSSLSNTVSSLNMTLGSLSNASNLSQADIDALQTAVDDLTSEIDDLWDEVNGSSSGGSVSTGKITAEFLTIAGWPMSVTISDTSVVSTTFKIKVTNNLDYGIKNVQMVVVLWANPSLPTQASGYPQLTGAGITWTMLGSSSNTYYYINGYGIPVGQINLGAGETKTYYMSLNCKAATAPSSPVTVTFSGDVASIEGYERA